MGKLSGIPPHLGDKSRPPDWKEALFKVGEKPLEPARTLQCMRRCTQSRSVPALALSSRLPKLQDLPRFEFPFLGILKVRVWIGGHTFWAGPACPGPTEISAPSVCTPPRQSWMVLASEHQRCWASGRRGVACVVEPSVPFLCPEQGSFRPALPGVGFGAAKTLALHGLQQTPGQLRPSSCLSLVYTCLGRGCLPVAAWERACGFQELEICKCVIGAAELQGPPLM